MIRHWLVFACLSWLLLPACTHAEPQPFRLASVVASAPAGAVIRVPPGVYAVNLAIEKPLTLLGSPGAVLDGGGQGIVVRVLASHVRVSGFVIRYSGSSLTDEDAGVFIARESHDVVISDNRIEDVLFGVYLDGPYHVTVRGNTVIGMRGLRVPDRGDGIHLWNDHACVIADNDISETRDGIYVYVSTPDNVIEGNHIHNLRYGVHYMYSNYNTLRGNVSNNNTAGFALMSSDHLQVSANRAYDDTSYGFLLNYVNYSRIADNEIRAIRGQFDAQGEVIPGAEGKAMFVYLSNDNTIAGNLLEDARIGIHVTAGSVGNEIYENAFVGNQTQVKYVQNSAAEWSHAGRGNYWSDYTGWDLGAGGVGNVPYEPNDGVDVLMWKYPAAKLLMSSPAILLLRYVQRAFPVFTSPGVKDSHPLMRLPKLWRTDGHELGN